MKENNKTSNKENNEKDSGEKGFTKPQWIGMIVGFGIAAFLFQLEEFGFIPAFLMVYGGYWIFKEIAELMLESDEGSDSKEDSQPELQASEKEDSSNDDNNYKKWLIFAIILLAVGVMIVGFSSEGMSDSEEPVPNEKTKSESQLPESPQNNINQQDKERNTEISPQEKSVDTEADDYVVDYTEDGTPMTWSDLDVLADALEREQLPYYKNMLEKMKKGREQIKELVSNTQKFLYNYPEDEEMKTLLNYVKEERGANQKMIECINDIIPVTEGVIDSIKDRDEKMYRYYSGRREELDNKAENLLEDYREKQEARKEYARNVLPE